jgi:hypothetical protein
LRVALANGRATAFGITAENRTPAPIETIEWATRKVYLSNWWMTEPYAAYILKKAEIQNLWPRDAAAAGKPSRRGRRKGVGSLASQDAPLISEMRRLIAAGDAASAYGAATLILDRAAGSGTDDSKRKRLVDRYHAEFPED